jgi:hypothetical protein
MMLGQSIFFVCVQLLPRVPGHHIHQPVDSNCSSPGLLGGANLGLCGYVAQSRACTSTWRACQWLAALTLLCPSWCDQRLATPTGPTPLAT